MADNIVIPINKTVDISQGTLITTLGLQNTNDQLIQGQSYANVLNVSVTNAGLPVELSGECMGYFVRQKDGSTVQVAGTISGNMASVEFPSFVYAYTGWLTITLSVGGTDLVHIATTVRLGRTFVVVDPGNVLPNLDEIQQIMLDVESALNQLSSALTASQQATQAANTAAGTANTAATAANKAATTANTAAAALNGLTATANTLEPTQPATATAQLVDGAWKITMGVPQGIQGIQGVRGITAIQGSAITGTSTTPTAYATGIASALAGDLYLYTGSDNANIGNVYTCTQGGDASTALWAYVTNWRGAPGTGNVSTVNGVQPDQEGNVDLPGQIYPCAAAALEAMSQEQQAELYVQGYRAIKTENNGTVVLLGLASDGSLEWMGCNQPRGNAFDNSDFAVAQEGYGGMHGAQVYAADRWKAVSVSDVSVVGDELTFSTSDGYGGLEQCIRVENLPDSESYTFSLRYRNGGDSDTFLNVRLVKDSGESGEVGGKWFPSSHDDFSVAVYNFTRDQISGWDMIVAVVQSVNVGSMVISHPVLLPGSYTAKTLPPFEEPEYAIELIKCLRFFRTYDTLIFAYGKSGESMETLIDLFDMRIAPTISGFAVKVAAGSGIWNPVTGMLPRISQRAFSVSGPPSETGYLSVTAQLSADL